MDGSVELQLDELSRAIVETVRAPLLVLDDSFTVISANPAFFEIYRMSPDEVMGHPFFQVARGQWDVPELRRLVTTLLPDRAELRNMEVRVNLQGLGTRFLLANARRLQLAGKRRNLILLSLEDDTVREELRREVRRHMRQLERSNRDLEEFAHAASHDLQEPLRKVRTYAQRLVDSLTPELLGEKEQQYLTRMTEATQRMQLRIDDLLKLGRLGRTTPAMQRVSLNAVVTEVVDDLEATVEQAGGRVDVPSLPEVDGDPAQLRLLFQNLISNSLKFCRDGVPPVITLSVHGPEEEEDAESSQGEVEIAVADNGIGFDPQYAHRIFRPFERLHGRESYEGTGVGLSICRRVMENHHGRIKALGRLGEGATFILTFPPPTKPEAS